MKMRKTLLLTSAALLLAGCGMGKQVTDPKEVDKITADIAAKAPDIKNFDLHLKIDGTSYDSETGKNIHRVADSVYSRNEDGEIHMTSTNESPDGKVNQDVYLVNDETYTKVLYSATTTNGEKETNVYGYKGNEFAFTFAPLYFILPETYFNLFSNPDTLLKSLSSPDAGLDAETKYYSKGEGNLTISLKATSKKQAEGDEEIPADATYEIKYDGGYFKSAKVEQNSNKGNKSTTECSLTVKSKFSVTLPSGWEDLVNKDLEEEE